MRPYPGQDWYKIRYENQLRLAQISGLDKDYVWMYWPDTDSQTRIRADRLRRVAEWVPVDDVRVYA